MNLFLPLLVDLFCWIDGANQSTIIQSVGNKYAVRDLLL